LIRREKWPSQPSAPHQSVADGFESKLLYSDQLLILLQIRTDQAHSLWHKEDRTQTAGFPQPSPPIEHRTSIWIRKRELREIRMGVVGNKHKCRMDHDGKIAVAEGSRFNALPS
jgi:hypothetical protein